MACRGCRRVVKALLWAGCTGGVLLSSCNTFVRVPHGRVDVDDDQVYVRLPGVVVDVIGTHVSVDAPGIEVNVDGHPHHYCHR